MWKTKVSELVLSPPHQENRRREPMVAVPNGKLSFSCFGNVLVAPKSPPCRALFWVNMGGIDPENREEIARNPHPSAFPCCSCFCFVGGFRWVYDDRMYRSSTLYDVFQHVTWVEAPAKRSKTCLAVVSLEYLWSRSNFSNAPVSSMLR